MAFEAAGLIEIEREDRDFPMLFHDPDKVVRHFIEGCKRAATFNQIRHIRLTWQQNLSKEY